MMNAQPFFSVVIPAYNRASLLPSTIVSVQNQEFKDWELLVVDDGSTDNTADVVQQMVQHDPRIHYIFQKNSERSVARNNGCLRANGRYICFLDSDDYYLPDHLQKLFAFISEIKFPEALIFTHCYFLRGVEREAQVIVDIGSDPIDYFLRNSVIPDRVCIAKSIFESFQFPPDIYIGEDTFLWCNIATRYPVYQLKERTVLYHLHDDNSVDIAKNCFLPRLEGLRKLFSLSNIRGKVDSSLQRYLISDCYFGIARHHHLMGRFFPLVWYVFKSVSVDPFSSGTKKKIYLIYDFLKTKRWAE
jgi:glycosyltransferase involved in cell wall biosynthesis